ncbi:MAG: hypothetical protein ACQETH_09685 [Candidatus Rifleibacteriota bacterium]
MKNIRATILLLTLVILCSGPLMAAECSVCGAQGISALNMLCPECGAQLHDPALNYNSLKKSTLTIQLYYTGPNPERMPPYGKIYINNEYVGNIPMTEKEIKSEDFSQNWTDGLGKEFTASYEKNLRDIPPGMLAIEIEMKFDRFFGLARSYKRVRFPYVGFESGKNTLVKHYFDSPVNFTKFKPEPRKPIPVISEMKLQGASGSVALNIPLFK